jgi:hypothetical protein
METSELIDWFCKNNRHVKWNSKKNKLEVSCDSGRLHLDLKVAEI